MAKKHFQDPDENTQNPEAENQAPPVTQPETEMPEAPGTDENALPSANPETELPETMEARPGEELPGVMGTLFNRQNDEPETNPLPENLDGEEFPAWPPPGVDDGGEPENYAYTEAVNYAELQNGMLLALITGADHDPEQGRFHPDPAAVAEMKLRGFDTPGEYHASGVPEHFYGKHETPEALKASRRIGG